MRYPYYQRVAIGLDQFANTLLGGWPDETLSARAYRRRNRPIWNLLYRCLDTLFHHHCERALNSEKQHLQSPLTER